MYCGYLSTWCISVMYLSCHISVLSEIWVNVKDNVRLYRFESHSSHLFRKSCLCWARSSLKFKQFQRDVSLNTSMWHDKYTSQCFQVLQFYSPLISMIKLAKLIHWRKLCFFLVFMISIRCPDEKNRITHFVTNQGRNLI